MNNLDILVLSNLIDNEKQKLSTAFPDFHFIFKLSKETKQEDIDKADIIIGNPSLKLSVHSSKLQMLQLNSAGSDYYIQEGVLHPHTKLANASGSYGNAIAEHTIGMILALNKNFKTYFKNMEQGIWHDMRFGKEIYHSTVAIIGLGDLGYQLASRLKAFDCHIIGVKRTMSTLPKHIDELYTIEALDTVLSRADYVILCLPQSKQTTHLLTKKRLLSMKKDAVLVNVGRGNAIDSNVLNEVLESNHLYGVALDVVDQEPLDANHPLWQKENVFITPHASGGFAWASIREHFVSLAIRNINHHLQQEELENSVDFTTGYRKVNTAYKNQ